MKNNKKMKMSEQQKELNEILNKLDSQENDHQKLGYEALSIIENMLEENPFDIEKRNLRIRLNANIFENTSEILKDAEFIIEHDEFKKAKMIGYEWMYWVYNDVMAMPDKAEEIITEQLIEIQTIYTNKSEKDKKESELLDFLANIQYKKGDIEKSLDIWYKSFKKYPFFDNNAYVGLLFLDQGNFEKAEELFLAHFDWSSDYDDGFRLKYGIKLKELYDTNKLDNYPTLIGLMFNVIRNETEHFKIEGTLDFYENYYQDLEKCNQKHPNNALIMTAVANTFLLDTKNYELAFQSFIKIASCEKNITFTTVKRIYKSAKKSKNDFLSIPFTTNNLLATDCYNALSGFSILVDKVKSKKKKKKISSLAIEFGEAGYNKFRNYLVDGNNDTYSNHPHVFAMLCNNYANAMGEYADLHFKKAEKAKFYDKAGDIHMEGYKISPFIENLENASIDYFKGKNYFESIQCSLKALDIYKDELSVYDFQCFYWRIVRSFLELKDIENAEKYYLEAKTLFNKVGKGSKEGTSKFIFTSKLFYEFAVTKKKEFQKFIPEMEWFLKENIAVKNEPKEHGLISHYLGICYKETKQKDKAIAVFQVAIDYLQDADWGFYDTKCDASETFIKELGGKAIKKDKPKKKKKSFIKKIWRTITLPFMIFALIGGLIYAAVVGNIKGEKKKKG